MPGGKGVWKLFHKKLLAKVEKIRAAQTRKALEDAEADIFYLPQHSFVKQQKKDPVDYPPKLPLNTPDNLEIYEKKAKFDSYCESLGNNRTFLRSQQSYEPPADVENRIANIWKQVNNKSKLVDDWKTCKFSSLLLKFYFLNNCFKEFSYGIPNSQLNTICSPADALTFYQTPVSMKNPLYKFKDNKLPPNLHITFEPVRFHPDTDSKFNGINAFPDSSNIVTGLRHRKNLSSFETKKNPFLQE